MTTPFQSSSSGRLLASAFTASKLYARSTNAADTGTLSASGLDESAVAVSESLTLAGQREVLGAEDFTVASALALSASQAGTVTVYREGTKATGLCYLTAQPSDGDTVTIGLTGFTQTYTFRAKASSTFVCQATAGISQGEYFDIALGASTHRFWYDIDAAGTGAPANPGGGLHEIDIATGGTASNTATATEAVVEAVTNLTASVLTDTVTVSYDILGTLTVTDSAGDVLGTITVVAAGTADAANQVAVGSTASDTAENLRDAINDSVGVEGTDYGTGTTANAYVTATVSGAILTLTDKIGCSRLLTWACAKSGANINIANPTGGVEGTLLGTLYTGTTAVYQAISLDDEALTQGYLPGLVNWTSDAVRVSGKSFSLHIGASNVVTAMAASYEYSTESSTPATWRAGLSSISNLDNNSQVITPSEHVEHVRLKINNTNATAASVNAKVVFAS